MKWILTFVLSSFSLWGIAQNLLDSKKKYTLQDTLRGSITPQRAWWDLTYYHLNIKVEPDKKFISGENKIYYKVLKPQKEMQIDLQSPMKLVEATQDGKKLEIKSIGNAHFITLEKKQNIGNIYSINVVFKGYPKVAKRAPWDGGFSWAKDKNKNHFVATSCQGIGPSIWWPNKDHMYDEVDSMLISVINPKGLTNISNGKLRKRIDNEDNTVTSHWFVSNPINSYGINVNLGDYVHFSETYKGLKGLLPCNYYVLRGNLKKAKKQFQQVHKMLDAFEYWFGPYPFYEDGFKLVEVPYLGMEHQSSVTYGNDYKNGYKGKDLSGTGWGLKFDFIIIHESGHEWFANSITSKDIADLWIHESFTNYSESLYLDYHYGKKAASEYVIGIRNKILNDRPIIGVYGVNESGSGDMYYKGGNMLHTLRQWVDDDEKWRNILRKMNRIFCYKTVTTIEIEDFLSKETEIDLSSFFNQYLRTIKIPTLEYTLENKVLKFRYSNIVDGFAMPIKVKIKNKVQWLFPNAKWQRKTLNTNKITIDNNFYVYHKVI